MAGVAQLIPVHLAGEPFPAIESNLDLEGEPGLQAHVHPAEGRVQVVVVQVQALARLAADGAAAVAIGHPVEGPARLEAAQDADQARLGAPFFGGELPGGLLFVDLAGVEVAIAALGFGLGHAGGFDHAGRHLLGVLLELLVRDVIGAEQVVHTFGGIQRAELALEDEAIKAGQSARDKQGEAL